MLSASKLSKAYGKAKILSDVTVDFPKGRLVAIIGPNGAGKSTLLSALLCHMKVDSGMVTLDGTPLAGLSKNAIAQRCSLLRQTNGVSLKITVRELVAFGRFPYHKGRLDDTDQAICDAAIAYMGLASLQDTYIDAISGGERQRAFIAMVLAQDTEYMLLDEPLNNLDMKYSVQIMKTLRRMVDEQGKTVIIVIHDINFAAVYADDILAMKGGRVVAYDRADAVITEATLTSLYDMKITVRRSAGRLLCDYFGVGKELNE